METIALGHLWRDFRDMKKETTINSEELESQAEEYIRMIEELLEERQGVLTQEEYDDALIKLDVAYHCAQTEHTREAAKRLAQEIKDLHRGA
jgi:transposase